MNLKKDRRPLKRSVNWFRKHAGYGKYVIDCRGHPCKVTEAQRYLSDLYGNGIDVISLLDGTGCCCSYLHCSPLPVTEHFAKSLKEPWYHWDEDLYLGYNYYKKYRGLKPPV